MPKGIKKSKGLDGRKLKFIRDRGDVLSILKDHEKRIKKLESPEQPR